jgi:D-methionine transport system permease protein
MSIDWVEIQVAACDTLIMLGFSVFFSILIGLPIGVLCYLTGRGGLLQNSLIYSLLSFCLNILRSLPFIILLIVMMPLTVILVGTSLGAKGVIPPLVVGAFPFFARLIENAMNELEPGIIYMAKSCGATTWQIVWHILLPEIFPNIISSITVTAILLVTCTAIAGVVGGGGLGDLAIRYGYQRFQTDIMIITVVFLIVLVQAIQFVGDRFVRVIKKQRSLK